MRFHRVPVTTLLTLTFATAALPAAAQQKVTVGGRPTPGQSVRVNIVQDADLTMKPAEGGAGGQLPPSAHVQSRAPPWPPEGRDAGREGQLRSTDLRTTSPRT